MVEPKHPTEKYILSRIGFHESGAAWYRDHGKLSMAAWSEVEAARWRAELADRFETRQEANVIPFPQGVTV